MGARTLHIRIFQTPIFARMRSAMVIVPLLLMVLVLTGCPIPPSAMMEGSSAKGRYSSNTGGACISLSQVMNFTPLDGEKLQRGFVCTPGQEPVLKGVVTYITDYLECKLKRGIRFMVESVINASWYKTVLRISFALAIILYGIVITLGLQQLKPFEILGLTAKMIIIYFLVSNFNVYDQYIIKFFENGIKELALVMTGALGLGTTSIEFADNTISTILSFRFVELFLTLLASGVTGGFYAFMLGFLAFFYASAIIHVVYILCMSMMVRYLLYTVGPLFLCFMLFKQTRKMFDNWIKAMISYSIRPIFVIALLGFFHRIMTVFFAEMAAKDYAVCYSSFYSMSVLGYNNFFSLNWWFFELQNGATVGGPSANVPINLWAMMTVAMLAFMLRTMVGWIEEVAATISGVTTATFVPLEGAAPIVAAIQGLAMRPVGMVGGALFGAKGADDKRHGGIISRGGLRAVANIPNSIAGVFSGGGGVRGVARRTVSLATDNTITKGAFGGWNNEANKAASAVRKATREMFGIENANGKKAPTPKKPDPIKIEEDKPKKKKTKTGDESDSDEDSE